VLLRKRRLGEIFSALYTFLQDAPVNEVPVVLVSFPKFSLFLVPPKETARLEEVLFPFFWLIRFYVFSVSA